MREYRPLIVIPARLKSSRLQHKLLLPLHGKPMIHWVCIRIKHLLAADFLVATDSELIQEYCDSCDFDCIITPPHFENGTERVAYVASKRNEYDFFVNVQADEPLLNTALIGDVIASFRNGAFNVAVSKVCHSKVVDPSTVKAALSFDNRIRFASRSNVPFGRDGPVEMYRVHGVYSYDIQTLNHFLRSPVGPLEHVEKVEQLRCIENDIPIYGVLTEGSEISVDTLEDYNYMLNLPKSRFDLC